ncbi:MAG: DUF2791 family P-loop domain-containing protein, partial [Desulfobacterales bacterium]
ELMILSPEGSPEVFSQQEENKIPIEGGQDRAPAASKDRQEAGKVATRKVNENAASPLREDSVTARQAIEALRLGVVPTSHLDAYTVGRDVELAVIYLDLESATRDGGFRVVLGDYGNGKTHFLEMAELLALEEGFLATRATMDSREVLPNKPRRIFHQLVRGIRYPDDPNFEARGLKPLLQRAVDDINLIRRWSGKNSPDYHPYLGPALFYMAVLPAIENNDDLLERLLDWIEGSEVASNVELEKKLRRTTAARARLYALKDFRTVTHLYTLILGGIAQLAREVGYKGLAIMLDEAEFYSVLRGRDRTFADILFRTFAAACLPPSMLRFDPEVLPKGGQAIHRRFSYRYKDEQPLYCIFALTHDPEGKAVLEKSLPGNRFMELNPFSTADYVTLASRVLSLYELAQTELIPGKELASLMAKVIEGCHLYGLIDNPRQALKFITEVIDITRHRPESLKPMLADLEQHLKSVQS